MNSLKIRKFSHVYNLVQRLHFLAFLLKISTPKFELSQENLARLGNLFFTRANFFEFEATIFFQMLFR